MSWVLVDSDAVGFSDGGSGHVYTVPAGAAGPTDLDVLFINSDTTVSTPSGFTLPTNGSQVHNQGAYGFYSFGGAGATVTITTSGNFATSLHWQRWTGGVSFDLAASNFAEGGGGATSTPSLSTPSLAGTGELVVVGAAEHSFPGSAPNTPVASTGYTISPDFVVQANTVVTFVSYKTNAGTTPESPSMSWTNTANDRAIIAMAFVPGGDSVSPPSIGPGSTLGSPTVSAAGSVQVAPPSIGPGSALGTPTVTANSAAQLAPPSIGPGSTLGAPTVTGGGAQIDVPSIGPGSVMGVPSVQELNPGGDTLVFPLAATLLNCLCAALAANPDPPARCCLRVGDEVRQDLSVYEDECCDGLAYVKINRVYPSTDNFPEQDLTFLPCGPFAYGVDLEMGVFRCAPTSDASTLPTCAAWTAAARQVANDQQAMRAALCCLRENLEQGAPVVIGEWTPLGPSGNCVGGTQTVTVQVVPQGSEGCC